MSLVINLSHRSYDLDASILLFQLTDRYNAKFAHIPPTKVRLMGNLHFKFFVSPRYASSKQVVEVFQVLIILLISLFKDLLFNDVWLR